MKQAYRTVCYWDGWGVIAREYPVRLTGKCKTVTGGLNNGEQKYFQCRQTIFNIPVWTYWAHESDIKFYDPVVETVYKCDCNK